MSASKIDEKISPIVAEDPSKFEKTPFGRRRRVPRKWYSAVTALLKLATIPLVYVYHRIRGDTPHNLVTPLK
jgi:hypothetical protein